MIPLRTRTAGFATLASPAVFLLLLSSLLLFAAVLAYSGSALAHFTSNDSLITHEWGTFTSIAAPDGTAMEWLPLTASTGLPNFVEHLQTANFKGGLRGTMRMETPVLYFYSPQETAVSVHISFANGLITEWYPHADVPAIDLRRDLFSGQKQTPGSIAWLSVQIDPASPNDFPTESSDNPYYAARQTSATPLAIHSPAGPQHEKFLFYRGVSSVLPALTATSTGTTVDLRNHFPSPIPDAILFERRGSHLGFRILGPLADQATFAPPTLDGSLEALFSDLEGLLITQGLFPDEAHAMLETWKSSWFEEGSRVLYVVPRAFVDSVLPLSISPAPAQLTRVFVGRIELITPATQQAVAHAFSTNDRATLAKFARFLEPILRTMLDVAPDQPTRDQLTAYLDSVYASFYSQPQN